MHIYTYMYTHDTLDRTIRDLRVCSTNCLCAGMTDALRLVLASSMTSVAPSPAI